MYKILQQHDKRHMGWHLKDPSMYDEVLEGRGQPQILIADLQDMAHKFVLHNVELMAIWCKYVSNPPKLVAANGKS